MSVTTCELDHPLSPSDGDFYCTEEELFESFMEIVNDPELQGHGDNQGGIDVDGQNENSAKTSEEDGFINDKNEPEDITNDTESVNHLGHGESESSHDTTGEKLPLEVTQNKNTKENSVLGHPQESSVNGIIDHAMVNANQNDLTNSVQLVDSTNEHLSELKGKGRIDSTTTEEGSNVADKILNDDNIAEQINTTAQDSQISDNTDGNLQSTENNNEGQSSIPLETNEPSSNCDQKPSNKSEPNAEPKPTNESELNSDPKSNNQNGLLGENSDEAEMTQNEVEGTALVEESTNQSELQIIEKDIEERLRMANSVCEELHRITQRLSHSSDELLDDDTTFESNETAPNTEPGDNNIETSENNNIDSHNTKTNDNEATVNGSTSEGGDLGEKPAPGSKRPNSLPKLVVSIQPGHPPKGTIPSPSETTPSPSLESTTSPLGISPTHMMHLNDNPPPRKHSGSDSLDSSEGSLGTPSTEAKGPINWDILNTAFEETDEDEAVYETSGSYGGFGLVLDEDSTDSVSVDSTHSLPVIYSDSLSVDDSRHRSVSECSTMSEVEFKEQFQKQNSIGSLERKIDGVLCSGYLFKLGGTGITPKNWRKRWCVVRQDGCMYYYKSARDKVPCGIIVLANYIVSHSSECNKKNCIKLSKGGGRTYFLCSETPQDMLRWMEGLRTAADNIEEGTNFVIRKEIIHNVAIPALSIKKPDCHGYLTKQGARTTRSWKRRYCVLKNGCLYYYREMADTTALGVAKLNGYTVDEVSLSGRRNGFRCVPPHAGMRTFTFMADNEYDKKRWIPCFQESIRANTST